MRETMKISKIEVTPINPERWGDDLDVVNAARVSFDKESKNYVSCQKFGIKECSFRYIYIKYLYR